MKFLKHSVLLALGFFLVAGTALAQGQQMQQQQQQEVDIDVSKKELKQFVSLVQERQKVQQSAMKDIQSLLSEKGMSMKRFKQVMMSKRNPDSPDSLKPNNEEQEIIKEVQPKMQEMQQKSQKKFQASIQDSDLSQERFQKIGQALRSDKDLMQRFQKEMQGSQGPSK